MSTTSEFGFGARILLQVDLEGHSAWVTASRSKPAVATSRADFAGQLKKAMEDRSFHLLSWKGDGGVYHAESTGVADFDFAVLAAREAASVFGSWRSMRGDRASLRLRISLHHATDIYIHEVDGFWTSDDLNVFLKYEREIGVSGTVAVTQSVFQNLSERIQDDFKAVRQRSFGISGRAIITETHYAPLQEEVEQNRSNRAGFFEWLRDILPESIILDPAVGPAANFRATLGDASFLFVAPSPESPLTVELVQHEKSDSPDLSEGERQHWIAKKNGLESDVGPGGDGLKVSVIRIVQPLSDIPLAKVYYYAEKWTSARAFHYLVETTSSLRDRLSKVVLEVQESGFHYPTIACCHVIVRTADSGTPQVLLCQRQQKGLEDTYSPGKWSFSFEEQLRPNETIEACVLRGMAEELLGYQAVSSATVRVLGAVIEKRILNPAFIVIVDVPLTFQQIVDLRQQAIDRDEHRQIAALAFTSSVLQEIANSSVIPATVAAVMRPASPDLFSSNQHWELHPTAIARAAMFLWSLGERKAVNSDRLI